MPNNCCVPYCKSNYASQTKRTTTFTFPKDGPRREAWIKAINRADFNPNKNTVVCMKHFNEYDIKTVKYHGSLVFPLKYPKLHETAVPCIFPRNPGDRSRCKRFCDEDPLETSLDPVKMIIPEQIATENSTNLVMPYLPETESFEFKSFEDFINLVHTKITAELSTSVKFHQEQDEIYLYAINLSNFTISHYIRITNALRGYFYRDSINIPELNQQFVSWTLFRNAVHEFFTVNSQETTKFKKKANPKIIPRKFQNELQIPKQKLSKQNWKGRQFLCYMCLKSFDTRKSQLIHIREHQPGNLHVCVVCRLGFKNKNILRQHIRLKHFNASSQSDKEFAYFCRLCHQLFEKPIQLTNHLIKHSDKQRLSVLKRKKSKLTKKVKCSRKVNENMQGKNYLVQEAITSNKTTTLHDVIPSQSTLDSTKIKYNDNQETEISKITRPQKANVAVEQNKKLNPSLNLENYKNNCNFENMLEEPRFSFSNSCNADIITELREISGYHIQLATDSNSSSQILSASSSSRVAFINSSSTSSSRIRDKNPLNKNFKMEDVAVPNAVGQSAGELILPDDFLSS